MITLTPIQPEQAAEARRVIYTVAHQIFNNADSLEETLTRYAQTWPLHDLDDIPGCYFNNGGTFLVLADGGRIVGTGGFWRLEEHICEIKRVWLLSEYQGRGLGYRLMMALLDEARQMGYTTARLETAPAYQPRAYAFYHRLGFYDIPRFGDDPDDVAMEMRL
jgi:putative acetyltransferase